MNYDIIGDIHGHASALEALLADMGYRVQGGAWQHPGRTAVFVGDFIDRGPRQVNAVDIVKRMVDAGSARAIMGNHEFNAIAWFTPDQHGDYLRPHHSQKFGDKNYRQHQEFLNEVNGTPKHREIIDWFLTLPLWLDLGGIRVVHACWHQPFMEYLSDGYLDDSNRLPAGLMADATREPADEAEKDTAEPSVFKAIEALTKGIEIPLPEGHSFKDKDGHERWRVRTRWWDAEAVTYRRAALLGDAQREALPDDPVPSHACIGQGGGSPLFFGHYWFTGTPLLLSSKVACLDYSIAKGGKLVAYRWDGEEELDASKFHWFGKPAE